MFGQFRPWLDCDRHCSFCYLTEEQRKITDIEKRQALLHLSSSLSDETKECDTIGLIGGELFADDKFFHEWLCVADSFRNADHIKRIFIGTHLLGDVDFMLDFCQMVGKEIQVCTSYDPVGRFYNDDLSKWVENIKAVQECGHKVVVSSTLSDALMHDDTTLPDGVDFKLQPLFDTEKWLEDICSRTHDGKVYNTELRTKVKNLPKRADVLKWFAEHKDVAKDYSTYDDKHASILWDYDRENKHYNRSKFICTTHTAECGHPLIAYCYADSDRCTMCDAKVISDE